jgi:GT2 family glycosyltransferase
VEDVAETIADDAADAADGSADPATAAGPALASRPSVLAVVVAHDPGEWFEETLQGLADQDYPRLEVLVIDTGDLAGSVDLAARVRAVLPAAGVLGPAPVDRGYGAAVNRILDEGPRAALYCFCHDDVALAPDAITHLVEEVVRSNAAIVGPKLVEWDDPMRLQHVGLSVDKFGVSAPLADEGEIDQAQRDAVADVFAVSGACMVVRADLFRTVGGFDEGMTFRGDDVDLCWRAQLAGARVMVVPDAVARHRETLGTRRRVDDTGRLHARHAVRSMLSCWGLGHLVRIVPQALVLTVLEVVWAVLHGRFRHARELAAAWTWNLRRSGQIWGRRRAVAAYRQVDDADVHQLQVRGSARVQRYFRGQMRRDDDAGVLATAGRDLATSLRASSTRQAVAGLGVVALVVLIGSRRLILDPIPAIGELQPLPGGTGDLLRAWWHGWNDRALGSTSPSPTAFGLLGLLGVPLLGHAALLRTLLVLAPLPVAALGMWRLTRPFGSRLANLAGTAVYLAVPVAANGYAHGSLSVLVCYAAAPWLLGAFGRLVGTAPFVPAGRRGGSFRHRVVALGLLVALVAAFVPFAVAVVALVAFGLLVGALVAGDGRGIAALVAGTFGAVVLAFVLHLPWSLSFLRDGASWATFSTAGSTKGGSFGATDLVRFHTGPFGGRAWSYAILAVPAFALLLARGVRRAWAIRGWFVALACWALVWSAEQGWLPRALPEPGVVLAPAAAGLALAAALGVAAFEVDLRRHRFGWRQFAPFAAVAAFAVLMLPFLAASVDGRWKLPRRDFARSYSGFVAKPEEGAPRILWIGDPDVLPVAGDDLAIGPLATLADGLAFATTDARTPTLLDRWSTPSTAGSGLVRDALTRAAVGDTNRLGQLLAVFGVRFVVVADHLAPAPLAGEIRPVDDQVRRTFEAQLDLERVESVNEAVTVYRNLSWVPMRAAIPAGTNVDPEPLPAAAAALAATKAAPALTGAAPAAATSQGPVTAGTTLYQSVNASANWRLRVDGASAARRDVFGWANAFAVDRTGDAVLEYRTPWTRRAALLAQVAAWVLAVLWWNGLRERRRSES